MDACRACDVGFCDQVRRYLYLLQYAYDNTGRRDPAHGAPYGRDKPARMRRTGTGEWRMGRAFIITNNTDHANKSKRQ